MYTTLTLDHVTITDNLAFFGSGIYCRGAYISVLSPSFYNNMNSSDIHCSSQGCNITSPGLDLCAPCTGYRDPCTVCGGNSSCLGCDQVPWSDTTIDDCGVCGGNYMCLVNLTTGQESSGTVEQSPTVDEGSGNTIIIAAAGGGGLLIVIVIVVIILVRKSRTKSTSTRDTVEMNSIPRGSTPYGQNVLADDGSASYAPITMMKSVTELDKKYILKYQELKLKEKIGEG
jgi:hypothetical protein